MAEHEGQKNALERQQPGRDAATESKVLPLIANPFLAHQQAVGNQVVQRQVRGGTLPPQVILGQQPTLGNQVVQRLLRRHGLQAKLIVTPPDDQYEQEAEMAADAVMRMPEPATVDDGTAEGEEPPRTGPAVSRVVARQVQRHAADQPDDLQRQAMAGKEPVVSAGLEERIVAMQGSGQPLPESERSFFEPRFGQDFSGVRVHSDHQADTMARAVEARAFTVGSNVAFARGEYAPGTDAGRHLLAHELTHVAQQTGGRQAIAPRRLGAAPAVVQRAAPVIVQRHASFEHRLLGDAPPTDLEAVATRISPQHRQHVLEEERRRLEIWRRNPEQVTRAQVEATWPGIRVVTLRNGLILTYGELNTLGDYLANPQAIDSAPRNVVLSLLQTVRQQGFNRLTDMLDIRDFMPTPEGEVSSPAYRHFQSAVGPTGGTGTLADISEVRALNTLTAGLDTNQYQSLVARNACHFAPFNWHRWEEFHTQARDLAQQGHARSDDELKRQAWLNNGYADHFLQDAFAAGHLINKTLIMQWFVQWVEEHNAQPRWQRLWRGNRSMWNIDLGNWEQIRTMTTARQPGLAGRHLYGSGPRTGGQSTDPQTAEEQSSRQARMDAVGVRAEGGLTQAEAYRNYLAFLNSSAVQAASGAVHTYFNERSLWVSSPAHSDAYQIWGDETLLTGGDGVRIAAETAHMSQRAIDELISTGQTGITAQHIRDRFPNQVRVEGSQRMVSLEQWNDSLRTLCWETIFPEVNFRIIDTLGPRMGQVSRDQNAAAPPAARAPVDQGSPDGGVPVGVGGPTDAGVPIAGVPDAEVE